MSEAKHAVYGFTPKEMPAQGQLLPKLPKLAPSPPRKSKAITSRVTDEFYQIIKEAAEENGVTVSAFIAVAIEDYWDIQKEIFKKAQYFNTCDEDTQSEILRHEKNYPPAYRQFSIARQTYPDAGQLNTEETEEAK